MPNVPVISENQRRANNRAIAERDAWRNRYKLVVASIRKIKSQLRVRPHDALLRVQLESLRVTAFDMLLVREDIGYDLRATSYPYADKEVVKMAKLARAGDTAVVYRGEFG